jgi:hypothetical protein
VKISNPSGPCIVITVPNVIVRDSDIGPCEGNANIEISGAGTNALIEYNSIHDGARGVLASGVTGTLTQFNNFNQFHGPKFKGTAIEYDNTDGGTIKNNLVTGNAYASDAVSGFQSSNMQIINNTINVNIAEPSAAAFTMGDAAGGDPGHNNYVAGNIVYQTGGVPAGVFGSSANTILEKNCLTAGIQAYNYSGTFVGVTVQNNVINIPASYVPDTSVIAGWATNINGTDCSLLAPPPPPPGSPTLLASVNAGLPFASMPNQTIQLLGGSRSLPTINDATGVTGVGTITGPATLGASTLRFGKITDPVNPGRQVFYHAAKLSDGATFFHNGRVDFELDPVGGAIQKSGTTYWIAFENYIPASLIGSSGNANVMDIHNSTPPSTVFGPFSLTYTSGIFPNPGISVITAWSTQSDPGLPGYNDNEFYPWTSNNPGFPGNALTLGNSMTYGAYPTDQWVKWVFKYRGDPTGTTGLLQAWMTVGGVTTQVLNLNNIQIGTAPQGYPTDYLKFGFDQYGDGGGVNGRWALYRSGYLFQDNGNTEPQIRALMQ